MQRTKIRVYHQYQGHYQDIRHQRTKIRLYNQYQDRHQGIRHQRTKIRVYHQYQGHHQGIRNQTSGYTTSIKAILSTTKVVRRITLNIFITFTISFNVNILYNYLSNQKAVVCSLLSPQVEIFKFLL